MSVSSQDNPALVWEILWTGRNFPRALPLLMGHLDTRQRGSNKHYGVHIAGKASVVLNSTEQNTQVQAARSISDASPAQMPRCKASCHLACLLKRNEQPQARQCLFQEAYSIVCLCSADQLTAPEKMRGLASNNCQLPRYSCQEAC